MGRECTDGDTLSAASWLATYGVAAAVVFAAAAAVWRCRETLLDKWEGFWVKIVPTSAVVLFWALWTAGGSVMFFHGLLECAFSSGDAVALTIFADLVYSWAAGAAAMATLYCRAGMECPKGGNVEKVAAVKISVDAEGGNVEMVDVDLDG
uniref:Uncharacterized protein n=1 Tax=Marseillevirus LCMAC103 TaxID=2506604 RepID=A0A481YVL6_9VIRU|nr:MAG: hypothetical protein LCMAC103_02890 [Marseillevirus LCMAC103]